MNTQTTDEQLYMKENNYNVKLWKALEELQRTPAYKLVFEDEYLGKNVVRNTSILTAPSTIHNGTQSEIMGELLGASRLVGFLHRIEQLGNIPADYEDSED